MDHDCTWKVATRRCYDMVLQSVGNPAPHAGVCGFLEIGLVAIIADRRGARIAVVHVALDTRYRYMGAGQRESRCGMIERCRCPGDRGMAGLAFGREPAGYMGGVCGLLEIGLVAAIAECRCARVAVVHVALDTRDGRMSAGQRKGRSGMIERCRCPGNRGVAGLAFGREPAGHMSGVCGFLETGLVAIITECRCARETVVEMALCTRDSRMGAGQWKCCPVHGRIVQGTTQRWCGIPGTRAGRQVRCGPGSG